MSKESQAAKLQERINKLNARKEVAELADKLKAAREKLRASKK